MLLILLPTLLLLALVLPLPVTCLVVVVFDCWPRVPEVTGLGLGLLPEGLGLDEEVVRAGLLVGVCLPWLPWLIWLP